MEDRRNTEGKRTRWPLKANEEEALLTKLEKAVANDGSYDNGSFKFGTIIQSKKPWQHLCPNFGLQSNPRINSKMQKWKKQNGIIYDMENKSGFK